jgi:hypothetical protein
VQSPTPAAATTPQRPSVAPAAFVQLPPQHSTSLAQASPFCVQNEAAPQMPFLQYLEQQSPFAAHVLPDVLHVALSAAHFPAVHLPPQHSPSAAHVPLSAVHCFVPHLPLRHENVQHWLFVVHVDSAVLQVPVASTQTLATAVHSAVAEPPPSAPFPLPTPPSRPVPASSAFCSLPQPPTKWSGVVKARTVIPQSSFFITSSALVAFFRASSPGQGYRQRPVVHGTPLQQSPEATQSCP